MKGMIVKLVLAASAGLLMVAGSASAQAMKQQAPGGYTLEPSTMQNIDQIILQMQQEMIQKNYSAMLLKPQMMAKMMNERAPQNFMQGTIQPVMMQKMRDQIKPQQMQMMQTR
ncbi:hypothetical protein GCAAIG_06345 [Candidatus Electronema halotolerans]